MKRIAFVFLVGLIFFGVPIGLLWADSQTIRPRANGHFAAWSVSGCTSDWECVDEETPDGDGTYVYWVLADENETFFCTEIDFVSIDSLKITARSRTTKLFGSIEAWAIGYSWTDGEANYWVTITDNINLGTAYTTVTSDASTQYQDSNPWTSATVNSSAFGIRLISTQTPDQMRCTWLEVTVHGTPAAEAGKKQGGIVQDWDNRGIVEGGIAR